MARKGHRNSTGKCYNKEGMQAFVVSALSRQVKMSGFNLVRLCGG